MRFDCIFSQKLNDAFISVANHTDHNSTGRQYLTQAFSLLTIDSDAVTFFCESESFQNSCISLVNQNGYTSAGLKYLNYVGYHLKNNSNGVLFGRISNRF